MGVGSRYSVGGKGYHRPTDRGLNLVLPGAREVATEN